MEHIIVVIFNVAFLSGLFIVFALVVNVFGGWNNKNKDEPSLADLYELTDRFAQAQQNINDRTKKIVINQQKLIDELKIRLDKLKEEE